MNGNLEARIEALTVAVIALLGAHPDRVELLEVFNAVSEASTILGLNHTRFSDEDLETLRRSLDLFRQSIVEGPPPLLES